MGCDLVCEVRRVRFMGTGDGIVVAYMIAKCMSGGIESRVPTTRPILVRA